MSSPITDDIRKMFADVQQSVPPQQKAVALDPPKTKALKPFWCLSVREILRARVARAERERIEQRFARAAARWAEATHEDTEKGSSTT
jgi:hypothetical protein